MNLERLRPKRLNAMVDSLNMRLSRMDEWKSILLTFILYWFIMTRIFGGLKLQAEHVVLMAGCIFMPAAIIYLGERPI